MDCSLRIKCSQGLHICVLVDYQFVRNRSTNNGNYFVGIAADCAVCSECFTANGKGLVVRMYVEFLVLKNSHHTQ